MSTVFLTQEQMNLFAEWCVDHAKTNDALIRQPQNMPGTEVVQDHMRAEIAALIRGANRLRSTESDK